MPLCRYAIKPYFVIHRQIYLFSRIYPKLNRLIYVNKISFINFVLFISHLN
jgi:hypothetical protein